MNEILDTLTKALTPLLIAVLTAAAGVAIAWLNSMKRKHDLEYQRDLTDAAVAATDQLMPNAAGGVKLAATMQTLGKAADRTLIEAAVMSRKPWFTPAEPEPETEPAPSAQSCCGMEASCGE